MTWKFMNTGFRSGRFNMEFDEALALRCRGGNCSGVLRVYGWDPPAISVGFNQRIEDFDRLKTEKAGIDIVRRPTGGRAILHAHELTYSVVMPIGESGVRTIYRFLNAGLLRGLQLLGVDARISDEEPDFRALYRDPASLTCFSNTARGEIQFNGKKLIGSAQRRFGSVVLQHGSFLLGPQHRHIVEFLAADHQNSRDTIYDQLSSCTIDGETILGRSLSFTEAASSIRRGFEEACDITFEDPVSAEDRAEENSYSLIPGGVNR